MTQINSRFNWTLRRQLGVVVVIGVGALAAVSGVALLGVQEQTGRLHHVGSEILPIQRLAAELDSNLLREDVEYQRMLRAGYAIAAGESLGADWLVKGREGFKKAKEASAHDQQTLTALLQSAQQGAGSAAREALGSLSQLTQAVVGAQSLYEARVQEVVQLIERGDLDTASAGISGVSEQRAKVHALLAEVSKSVQELTEATVVTSAHDAQQIRWQLAGVLLGSAVVMLSLSVWMMRRLSRQAVQTKEAIEKVASGDLISPVPEGGHDELGEILQAVGLMQGRLSTLVSEVREGANSVATASVEIAQGNQDLSHRTEQQAAALEQTASSMEQLGATVQHNASNAQQADHLAQTASEVAIKGGAVVSEVVSTMRSINDSSRKISDIISVIDGIAFQTNILSLNAAVEAARAGEQGRGFAVVATEVRSLAQRSAQAAREIKSLISSNVERVEQGSVLVDKAGATMDEVVASIRQVTEIVNQISQASREQNEGVSQVGVAVSQMDTQTQQNAALVEQSAAAADALREQAQHLLHAVSAFRTS